MNEPTRIGQQLGNYRLIRLLGQGGFAEVYLGEHVHLGSNAAIKVLTARLTGDESNQFRMEARTLVNLEHPNIVRVLDFGIQGQTPFLVMSYAPNGTLRQRHAKGVPLPLATIVYYVKQVAEALQYAHDQKLIHRDIKPENMLLGRRNEVLLSDFGIATIAHNTSSMSIQIAAGTIPYMAPEQIQEHPRPASDQYALGIVIYEWLSGERPFQGSLTEIMAKHMMTPPPPLRSKISTISPEVEQVVFKALTKDPQQRFSNVLAFANALEQAAQFQAGKHKAPTQAPHRPLPLQIGNPAPTNVFQQQVHPGYGYGQPPVSPLSSPPYMVEERWSPGTPSPVIVPLTGQVQGAGGPLLSPSPAHGWMAPVAPADSPPHPKQKAQPRSTLLKVMSYAFLTGILGVIASFLLIALGKLSPQVAYAAIIAGGAIAAIVATVGLARKLFNTILRGLSQLPVFSASIATVLVLTVIALLVPPLLSTPSQGSGGTPVATAPGSTAAPGNTTAPGSSPVKTTSSPGPVTFSTSTPSGWHAALLQSAPNCHNPGGVAWQAASDMVTYVCNSGGLAMQESSVNSRTGELDLNSVNGKAFNLTTYRVQVQVTFNNPNDLTTEAALLVQMPRAANDGGAYIFALMPASGGTWELYHTTNGDNPLGYAPVNVGSAMTYSPGTPGPSSPPSALKTATMGVEVKDSVLTGYINGAQMFSQIININAPSSVFGLVVVGAGQQSGIVQYSNFELDVPNT